MTGQLPQASPLGRSLAGHDARQGFSHVGTLSVHRAAFLEDGTGLRIEWQRTRESSPFRRMIDTWRDSSERFDGGQNRFRPIVVKMAGSPRDWVVGGRIGRSEVYLETVVGTDFAGMPLFEDGAIVDKVPGCLSIKKGWRIGSTLEGIKSLGEPQQGEALDMP